MHKLLFNLLEAPKLTFLSPTFCFPSFTSLSLLFAPCLGWQTKDLQGYNPCPFYPCKVQLLCCVVLGSAYRPSLPYTLLCSEISFLRILQAKMCRFLTYHCPPGTMGKGGALAQRNFSFSLGKHSLLVRTQEASAQQCMVGIGKNESGNEANRREWCDFLLSGLLSCRYL